MLPYTLNAADFRNNGYAMLILVVPLLALAGWNCLKAMRRSSEPQLAPVWKNLAAFGNAEQLSQQIEAELQPAMIRKYGKLQLTPQWMVRRKLFSTWVSPVADVAWVYKKVTKHRSIYSHREDIFVVLVGRHRQRTEEQMKEKAVNELLVDMAHGCPGRFLALTRTWRRPGRKTPQA